MKIVITGATGLIGSELLRAIDKENNEIVALSRNRSSDVYTESDYSVENLKNILKDCDCVVHLASKRGGNAKSLKVFEENIEITENLLQAMNLAGCKRLIYLSSISVYSDSTLLPWREDQQSVPVNFYGLSKKISEEICQFYSKFNIETLILRCAHVLAYEKSGYMLDRFITNAIDNEALTVTGKSKARREFIYLKDVVRGIIFGIEHPEVKGVFNLGTSLGYTNIEVASAICKVFGVSEPINYCVDIDENIESSYMNCEKYSGFGFQPKFSLEEALEDIKQELQNVF